MKIQQLYTQCLSEATYYIESKGEVAIIDPLRDIDIYLNMAINDKATIKYVFETNFHADFVSGHVELAKKTGAKIVFGPSATAKYKFHKAIDGERFNLGEISLTLLHTPGHTLESSCYLLKDKNDEDYAVFTGDTLFVGDVGRPDLAVKAGDITKEDLAELLYDSLRAKILPLSDHVIVYPGHGAGSACGKNIGQETSSTIGEQKRSNYALQEISKQQFVEKLTKGLMAPPNYFFTDVKINKNGYEDIEVVLSRNHYPLCYEDFMYAQQNGAIILDTRSPQDFAKGHIEGAINIGLKGQFAHWVGTLINPESTIILITDKDCQQEAILRLARVGYEKVLGFLKEGIDAVTSDLVSIPNELALIISKKINKPFYLLDVRNPVERQNGYIIDSIHIPLNELLLRINELEKEKTWIVYCAGGYRSMIACSILTSNGFKSIQNVDGGFEQLRLVVDPSFLKKESALNQH
jgi:hydroxyacylglutathione hydrolase